jgi:small-conductance mechanosensitive channel
MRRRAVVALALTGTAVLAPAARPSAFAQPAGPPAPAAPAVVAIPVPEIARRAEEVSILLRQGAGRIADDDSRFKDAERQLRDASDWIDTRLVATTQALDVPPSPGALAMLSDSWLLVRGRLNEVNQTLTRRALDLERELGRLEGLRATWSVSRIEALAADAPAPVLERIDATLAAIVAARRPLGDTRANVLRLQDRVVRDIARCDAVLARIGQVRGELVGAILTRDSAAIWRPEVQTLRLNDLGPRLRRIVGDVLELAGEYFAGHLARVPLQAALFVVVLLLVRQARVRTRERAEEEAGQQAAPEVFAAPLSSAFAVALLATEWIYPSPPYLVLNGVGLLILAPVVLVVRRMAPRPIVPAVYALAAFFLVDRVRELCAVIPRLEQQILLVELVVGAAFLAFAVRSASVATASGPRWWLAWIARGEVGMLVIGVVAGAVGYMRLARLLGSVVVYSNYAGFVLYAGVRIGEGLVAHLLRVRPLASLRMTQRHRPRLERGLQRALRWLGAGGWAYVTVQALGVAEPIGAAVATALTARYVRGSVDVSVGDVLFVGLTIIAAFLVSAFVRFVLREEVYPRTGLAPGPSYALSSLLHYALILTGFLLAVSALGIDLTRVTILAGAFGIGIGIGLQGVVANIVAGLVLLLEHRIHVGDSIETAELQGEVREIGVRASTIRTWTGAEVVVPNGTLVSERVTNWTLSDRRQRVDLHVTVTYASDPQHVIDVLRKTGELHPRALPAPAPLALCTGFCDRGLQFDLRVWTARCEEAEQMRSELAMAIHAALAAAGIDIALPQHDVRIRTSVATLAGGVDHSVRLGAPS